MSAAWGVLWDVCAVIGVWFVLSVLLVLVWIAANERAGRKHSEKAAKQLSGWR